VPWKGFGQGSLKLLFPLFGLPKLYNSSHQVKKEMGQESHQSSRGEEKNGEERKMAQRELFGKPLNRSIIDKTGTVPLYA
jgi:hypothetical protein